MRSSIRSTKSILAKLVSVAAFLLTATFAVSLWSAGDSIRSPIKSPGSESLFQIRRDEKWGFMDRTGRIVIKPRFDDEGDFFSERAKVRVGHKWGYIDPQGRIALAPQYDDAGDFREGVAPVLLDRQWGFINLTGSYIATERFQQAGNFHEALARVATWKTIDCDSELPSGRSATYTPENAPRFAFPLLTDTPVSNGCYAKDARLGYVDLHGQVVVAPLYSDAQDFSEGLAAVREKPNPSTWKYIDREGRTVIQNAFAWALPFSCGLAGVQISGPADKSGSGKRRWGFIDKTGAFKIQPSFDRVRSFSEGMALFRKDDLWGYVNLNGAIAITPQFSQALPFSEGIAGVWKASEAHEYFIDKRAKRRHKLNGWAPGTFADGLAVLQDRHRKTEYVGHDGIAITTYSE